MHHQSPHVDQGPVFYGCVRESVSACMSVCGYGYVCVSLVHLYVLCVYRCSSIPPPYPLPPPPTIRPPPTPTQTPTSGVRDNLGANATFSAVALPSIYPNPAFCISQLSSMSGSMLRMRSAIASKREASSAHSCQCMPVRPRKV